MRQRQDTLLKGGWKSGSIFARLLCLLAAFLLSLQPANAQTNIAAELVAESIAPAPSKGTSIALHFTPSPGWHGYWQNPGEAGFPGRFEWTLPKGVSISTPRYPVPERLIVAELMNHVFNGEHTLIARLALDKNVTAGTHLPIKLKAEWLACTDKICVPEQDELSLDLVAGDGAVAPASLARFDGWRSKLARPLGGDARFAIDGDHVRLAVPWPASQPVKSGWFFAATERAIAYPGPQMISQQGDTLIIDLPRSTADFEKPAQLAGVLALPDGSGIEIVATPGTVGAPAAGWAAIIAALGGALLGGLLLNIMPCVFPVISLKALSLAKGGGDERAARQEALSYTGGVILTCLAMGGLLLGLRAGGQAVGWAFQLQQPVVILFLLLLAVAITLNLAGLFEVRGLGDDGGLTGKRGNAGAFWTGVLAAFVATPCTGPFMAAALGAALILPVPAALAIFAGLGLGMALPFLALGFVPALRRMMPKPGAWMVWFRRALAVPMALTAAALIWLLWRQTGVTGALIGGGAALILSAALWAMRQRLLSPILLAVAMAGLAVAGWPLLPKPTTQNVIAGAMPFNETGLAMEIAAKRPVFLYFTADWCLTCKVNEAAAIDRAETIAHFKARGITVMVGDWSRNDPAITRFLEGQGRSGVPLYLFYPAGGGEAQVLPQVLTPAMLTAL